MWRVGCRGKAQGGFDYQCYRSVLALVTDSDGMIGCGSGWTVQRTVAYAFHKRLVPDRTGCVMASWSVLDERGCLGGTLLRV